MNMFVNYIFRIITILVGALDISYAIKLYKSDNYFGFGVTIMMAVYMAIYLFKMSMET